MCVCVCVCVYVCVCVRKIIKTEERYMCDFFSNAFRLQPFISGIENILSKLF